MGAKEGVNQGKRQRGYGARDKERIIESVIKLHKEGYSQVDIAKMLNISRGTIMRWNNNLHFIQQEMVIRKQGCSDLYLSSIKEITGIAKELYKYGDIRLNRKYEKFLSLMI
ncbi:helix-turn-helix domain-containing protein [Bacillus rubiinfantis]|uniref:helix-turn-helix domain-containing protein n=1 Tax=Bacillus rubiinfantis TaxID=1499680 RepID=UPI00069336E8|nr:helix-turn-helix domain-containing protein [Bacillus rubiinfantis]